ncbi:MAG TPA: NADP-dependent oxidoreductase [Solirubrobacterales bacterium]
MPTVASTNVQVIDSFGGADLIHTETQPIARPGAGEVQLKVAAVAVNPVDLQTRSGTVVDPEVAKFPMVLGWDVAGTIHEVGTDVEGWQVGDRVAAMVFQPIEQRGTYAEYLNLDAELVAAVPDGLGLEQAATIPLAGLIASQMVRWVDLSAGDTLLVDGPVGGVGRLVVQLASRAGIEVIAVAKPEDRAQVIELGAGEVVERGDFTAAVHELHPDGVDAAIDVVGGAAARAALASVRDGGALGTTYTDYADAGDQLTSERDIRFEVLTVHPDTADLAGLLEAAGRGELITTIDTTYALSDAAQAHRRYEKGGVRGRLVLVP